MLKNRKAPWDVIMAEEEVFMLLDRPPLLVVTRPGLASGLDAGRTPCAFARGVSVSAGTYPLPRGTEPSRCNSCQAPGLDVPCGFEMSCTAILLIPPRGGLSPISVWFLLSFADDFGSQVLHLLGVVVEQAELDEFGSRIRDLAQTSDAG